MKKKRIDLNLEELIGTISEYAFEGTKINQDSKLVSDLRMDSLDTIDLIMKIQEKYKVKLPDEYRISRSTTVKKLYDYIIKKGIYKS